MPSKPRRRTTKKKRPARAPAPLIQCPRRTSAYPPEAASLAALDEIERTWGDRARALATVASEKHLEAYVRQHDHQFVYYFTRFRNWMSELRALVAGPALDRAALGAHAEKLAARFAELDRFSERGHDGAVAWPAHFARENVAAMVDEARERALTQLEGGYASSVTFTADVDRALDADLDCHAFVPALAELIANAAESYDPEATRMDVLVKARVRENRRVLTIEITDHGRGLGPDERAAIYMPFVGKHGRAGMGCHLARRAVEDVHGGCLDLESERGQGSTFRLYLPRRQEVVHPHRRRTLDELLAMGTTAALAERAADAKRVARAAARRARRLAAS